MLLFCIRKDTFNRLFPSLVHPLVEQNENHFEQHNWIIEKAQHSLDFFEHF